MPSLKSAFDTAGPAFSDLIDALKPDSVIYDFLQPWALKAAREWGLPGVASLFLPCSAAAVSFLTLHSMDPDGEYPFSPLRVERSESDKIMQFVHNKANGTKDMDRLLESIRRSEGAILIKTCREIEGKYVDYLAKLVGKEVIAVGPLIQEPAAGDARDDEGEIMRWLEERESGSVVFVSFRSECFLSKEEMEEVAHGLELASEEAGFVWVVRLSGGDGERVSVEALPEGFQERTKDRGMVVGFVSHCRWGSTLEAIVFGIPIIAMPMHLDQPLNAKLVADLGVGMEVRREDSRFKREEVAKVIKQVVIQEEGEQVRKRAKELSARIRERQEEETSAVMKKLEQLFGKQNDF
ncbi:flavanone 7-O-glucoside 2''-O-beta-L-rhamnosyltransferase-like [Eucalyptus grandis]|uniref:flavanone 7-O-glucoside 2''-O-beta-L-rhamnosyltransferase-like n=1 Tax=Eucalyptus grandis TaxID=71139 RepID=UPI00192EBEBD|nr:flavanone 7-O-glucoside 2''-O-beta-L-rhamnosyltransferase-like [Eucalyptus grandis]